MIRLVLYFSPLLFSIWTIVWVIASPETPIARDKIQSGGSSEYTQFDWSSVKFENNFQQKGSIPSRRLFSLGEAHKQVSTKDGATHLASSPFKLTGTIIDADRVRVAFLQIGFADKSVRAKIGDEIDGWRVETISEKQMTLRRISDKTLVKIVMTISEAR